MASSSDPTFNALPTYLQRRIDRAFNAEAQLEFTGSQRRTRNNAGHVQSSSNLESGGGFIIDDDVAQLGGGFIVEDTSGDEVESPNQIPMSSVPAALQHLDLPPDDEQVLSVFRNAASGWSSSTNSVGDNSIGEGAVSLEDWRTVCAVLFEHHNEEYEDDSEGGRIDETAHPDPEDYDEHGAMGADDQYVGSEGSDDDSDDEYIEGPAASTSRRRTRARQVKSSSSSPVPSSSGPKRITPRQKQTCLEAFALFFPSVPPVELANQKIMIKDLQRVAKLLGEKLKAEEVGENPSCREGISTHHLSTFRSIVQMVDLLETFSSSPDKSMNLEDFERMMVAARLA
jgi:hypothetical protein